MANRLTGLLEAPNRLERLTDPNLVDDTNPEPIASRARDVFGISQETGLNTEIVDTNYQQLKTEQEKFQSAQTQVEPEGRSQLKAWSPGLFERIKLYFYTPPPIGGFDRTDRPFRTLGKLGLVGAAEVVSGALLTFPDIAAAKILGKPTLGSAVASALGIELTPEEIRSANLGKNISSLMTAGALTRPVIARLPARAAYRYILGGIAQFGSREAAAQTVERITVGDPVEFQEINRQGLIGALFGTGEAVVARASRFLRFKAFVKARPEFRDTTNFPPKLIKKMFEAGDAAKGGMSQANIEKIYGKDVDEFLFRMNHVFGRATVSDPLAKVVRPRQSMTMIRKYNDSIAQATSKGDVEAVQAIKAMREVEVQALEQEVAAEAKEALPSIVKPEALTKAPAEPAKPSEITPPPTVADPGVEPVAAEGVEPTVPAEAPVVEVDVSRVQEADLRAVQEQAKKQGVTLTIAEREPGADIKIALLEVDDPAKRGKGLGTEVLRKVFAIADKHGLNVTGTPTGAFGDVQGDRIEAFLKREGFEETGVATGEALVRKAQPAPAAEVPERDILGGVDPIHQISLALKEARAVRPLTEAQQKATLRKRVGAAAGALESSIAKGVSAEEAMDRSLGLLKGPLASYDQVFEPIRDIIEASSPGVVKNVFNQIGTDDTLQFFQKQDTKQAFRKLIDGNSLTFREAQLLEDYFGIDIGIQAKERVAQAPLADRLVTLWRAGLLTGIKTSGLNTFSNMSHGATETAKDIPAVAVDTAISLFTGKRTIGLTVRGAPSGMVQGAKLGWNYMKTGHDERNIGAKLDYTRTNFGDSKFARGLQSYEEFVFHLMGAEDQPFYYGAKSRSLFSQAIAQAKNAGVKGAEREVFVQNLIENPTDEMLKYAAHDAEIAVFQNRTAAGDIARAIHQSGTVGKIIVPFSRTPAAVATQIVNYSPVGTVIEVFKQIGKGEFDQRTFSQAVGRSVVGTAPLAIGAALFTAGLVTLDRPKSERERELQAAEGRKPNSILINGKWRSPEVLGPAGSLIIIGAHFQKNFEETGSPTQALAAAVAGGAKTFSEQTFVTGMNRALAAMSDPERAFETFFSGLAGSTVPTLIADIARTTDDVERRSSGAIERIMSRIPGQRKKLEPQIDAYGQDLPRYGGNSLEIMLDPTRPAIVRRDLVVEEVRRLWDLDIKVAPTKIGDRKGFEILTPEENTTLWRRAGELIYTATFEMIKNPIYKSLEDSDKGKFIDKIVKQGQDTARAGAAQHKLSQGISMEALREDGLVTIDVLRLMIKMGVVE